MAWKLICTDCENSWDYETEAEVSMAHDDHYDATRTYGDYSHTMHIKRPNPIAEAVGVIFEGVRRSVIPCPGCRCDACDAMGWVWDSNQQRKRICDGCSGRGSTGAIANDARDILECPQCEGKSR